MLIRLIISPADQNRSGANQMRQHLTLREHFRRRNAELEDHLPRPTVSYTFGRGDQAQTGVQLAGAMARIYDLGQSQVLGASPAHDNSRPAPSRYARRVNAEIACVSARWRGWRRYLAGGKLVDNGHSSGRARMQDRIPSHGNKIRPANKSPYQGRREFRSRVAHCRSRQWSSSSSVTRRATVMVR